MPRHVDVFLNGIGLRDTVPRVTITQITEDPAALDVLTASPSGRDGSWFSGARRRSLKVTVTGNILEVHDLAARAAAIEAIAAWAAPGGLLQVSYRMDRRLRVVATKLPSMGAVRDYTRDFTVELTAFAVPFWEDDYLTKLTPDAGATGSVTIANPGTAPAPLEAVFTLSGSSTTFTLTAGSQSIALSSLPSGTNSVLTFGRDSRDNLIIDLDGSGMLSQRSAASSDDLWLAPGPNTVTWTAAASVSPVLSVRGRYL